MQKRLIYGKQGASVVNIGVSWTGENIIWDWGEEIKYGFEPICITLNSQLKIVLSVFLFARVSASVPDPDPGSGAFLTPGSGISFFQIPDPTHIF
jgi:hypothetical protein